MMATTATVPTLEDIRAAARTIEGRVHRTPLLSSRTLGAAIGAPAWLKAELLQRVGAFKPRGAFNRVDALTPEERERGVIAISAGNHAQALALAAAGQGVDTLILMAHDANPMKVAATRGYGAAVDTSAQTWPEADERMRQISEETGRVIVHPYDDPLVIAGQGTIGLELVEDLSDLDVVVVPIGGGGLISGIAIAVKALRPGTRVIGVEPELSDAMRVALEAGHPIARQPGPTMADALRAPVAGGLGMEICGRLMDELVLVSEDELRDAMRFLYQRAKLAAEPGGAAGVAALLAGKADVRGAKGVAVIISGGNVTPEVAASVLVS